MKDITRKKPKVNLNFIDRVVSVFSPEAGAKRYQHRLAVAMAESYTGASKSRRSLSAWLTEGNDADGDILPTLSDLRERSRDLCRNNPLALGAINTKVTAVVGTGLKLQCRIDRELLGLGDDEADAWEKLTEAEFELWSKYCDIERTLNFPQLQSVAFRSVLENGDTFALTPNLITPGSPYGLKLQLVEADRVCNDENTSDSKALAGGVESDKHGAPVKYHIMNEHPGGSSVSATWTKVDAFGKLTGRRNVLHLYNKIRIGQSRGVPDLAPVIETIKQLGRYTEAEVMAAVVSAMFTVFIKSDDDEGLGVFDSTETGASSTDKDFKMGNGAILELGLDESIETANPGRPNQAFDPFVLAVLRQIGVALELPFEILTKHFTSSYSASKAALLEAWRFFKTRQKWLADSMCRPVYELFLIEAVASGRIYAPGLLNGDPLVREAWLGSDWVGPVRGDIDEVKSITAAKERIKTGLSTHARESLEMNGSDFDKNHTQLAKEMKKRREADLAPTLEMENGVVQDTEQDQRRD